MGTSSRNTIPLLLLVMAFAAIVLAQEPTLPAARGTTTSAPPHAASPASPQSEHVEGTAAVLKVKTRLVVVDVIALDHKGAPVADLKADDFILQEENKPQKIRVFNFQQGLQGQAAVMTPATLSANRITNMPRFKTNSALNVLLLDGINVSNTNQKYAREQMLKFLEKLPAGQPIAVYAMGTKLRMLQDFTVNPTLLRDAVKKAKFNASGARSESSNALDLPPATLDAMPLAMLQQVLRFGQDQAINQMDERVRLTIEQLSALARNLSGYPGRKNLVWLSEAFPAYLFPNDPDPTGRNSSSVAASQLPIVKNYQGEINHAADLLANAQVAVYPVDAGAVGNHDSYSSLSNTDSNGNYLGNSARGAIRNGMGGSAQASEISNASETAINSHSTMNSVAEQTGGKAFYNTNDLNRAIRDSMEDGSTYYTLGYYPENKDWDGRFRRISLKVTRPGIKLHYRQGFYAVEPKVYAKQDPKIQAIDMGSALDISNPISTALPFQAVVIPPSTQNGNKVQINFGIDAHAIGFELKEDGLQHAAIDCGVRAYSKTGESLKLQGNTFNAALTPEQYQKVMKAIFPCNQTLELPPGEYLLRLAVRDTNNGLIGTANGNATVPAGAANPQAKPEEKRP
ncbi:MAG TPA: VWA domain-containing protein [Candidatus Angelobacter sp.]|nr:VWA domain-containing protein [Candidatus Angelobacter sp.]